MIDEEVLSEALREAAESIRLSDGASDRILAAAQTPTATGRSFDAHKVIPRNSRGRVVMVAAVLALLIGGITASVLSIPTHSSNTSSSALLPDYKSRASAPIP